MYCTKCAKSDKYKSWKSLKEHIDLCHVPKPIDTDLNTVQTLHNDFEKYNKNYTESEMIKKMNELREKFKPN